MEAGSCAQAEAVTKRPFARCGGMTMEAVVWLHTRYRRSLPWHIIGILLSSKSAPNTLMAPVVVSKVRHCG
jgi:hypothetical protein